MGTEGAAVAAPLLQDSAFTALRGQFDPVVIVRESPGQLETGEGQPVTVLKRQSGSSHEMAPMAEEVLTHRARTAGHCPRQGICERWLHKERGVVELWSFLGLFSIYRYTYTAHAARSVGHWGRLSFSAHQRVKPAPSTQVGVDGAKERAVVHVLPPHRNRVTVSS